MRTSSTQVVWMKGNKQSYTLMLYMRMSRKLLMHVHYKIIIFMECITKLWSLHWFLVIDLFIFYIIMLFS